MILISYSGGKDSNAMLLLAKEMGLDFIAVYQDTGFEYSEHYRYMDYVSEQTGVEIVRVKNKKYDGLIDMVEKKMSIPNRLSRFCTSNLKMEAMKDFIKLRGDIDCVWVGVRTGESSARAKRYAGLDFDDTFPLSDFPDFSQRDFGHIHCRLPIVNWTEQMVWDIHDKYDLKKNPLYDLGAKRVGCYPCVMSSESAWFNTWQTDEGKKNIRELERVEKLVAKMSVEKGNIPMTFRPNHKYVSELIEQFEQRDRQVDMFSDDDIKCSWCHD